MNLKFKCWPDRKHDKYEFRYEGDPSLEVVIVSGSAMRELSEVGDIGEKHHFDIGCAIAQYLAECGVESKASTPVLILQKNDPSEVGNALRIDEGLVSLCKKYLAE